MDFFLQSLCVLSSIMCVKAGTFVPAFWLLTQLNFIHGSRESGKTVHQPY